MGLSVLISAWLVGVLGGLHCFAMCGGLLSAVAVRDGATQPLHPRRVVTARQVAYHAGRITTYVLLGAAFGAAGALALRMAPFLSLQRALYVGANLFLLLLGARLVFGTGMTWLQGAGAGMFSVVLPAVRPLLRQPGVTGRISLGLLWGLVPCTLVYSVLPLALFAGGAWQGGAIMLAFGLGTLPNLLAAGVLLSQAKRCLGGKALRYVAGGVLVAFALLGIWRVLYAPGALAQGPFCLVP